MWHKPEDEWPDCKTGERVVGIVKYLGDKDRPSEMRLVVIFAAKGQWCDIGDDGITPHDCELWAYERDVIDAVVCEFLTTRD